MKIFKILSLITFIFFIVSCKKSVTDSKEYTLVGKWSFDSATFEHSLITNSIQTAKIPYSGVNRILVSGSIRHTLDRLAFNNNTETLYVIDVENDIYIYNLLSIDLDTKIGTLFSYLAEKTFVGSVDFTFNGTILTVNNSVLVNQEDPDDSITLDGEISFETVDISANTSTSIFLPAVISTYPRGFMQYEFREDGTFLQTENNNDGSITSLGTWESNGNTITTTITEGNLTEVHEIEYVIENNLLTGIEKYDLCQADSACLSTFENYYQLDEGSLNSIEMVSSIVLRAISEI